MLRGQAGTSKRFRTDFVPVDDKEDEVKLKTYDINSLSFILPSGAFWACVNQMTVGTASNQRLGRTVHMKRLQWRVTFNPSLANLSGYVFPYPIRVLLFIDKHMNGVYTTAATSIELISDALGAAPFDPHLAHYNPLNVPSRYEILFDKTYHLPPVRGTSTGIGWEGASYDIVAGGTATASIGYPNYAEQIQAIANEKIDIELDLISTYGSATAFPLTNGLYAMMDCPSGNVYGANYSFRCQYTDL